MARGQRCYLSRAGGEDRFGTDDQRPGTLLDEVCKSAVEIALLGDVGDEELQSEQPAPARRSRMNGRSSGCRGG